MDDFDFYRLFKTLHVIAVLLLGGGFVLEGIVGALLPKLKTVQEVRVYARLLYISETSSRSRPLSLSPYSVT